MTLLQAQKLVPGVIRGTIVYEDHFELQLVEAALVNFHYLAAGLAESRLVVVDRDNHGNSLRHATLLRFYRNKMCCTTRSPIGTTIADSNIALTYKLYGQGVIVDVESSSRSCE